MVRSMPLWHRATLAILEGRFNEFTPLMSQAARLLSSGTATNARQWGGMLLYVAGRQLGLLRVTDETLGFVERYPQYPIYRVYLAVVLVGMGDLDAARPHFDRIARDDFATIPRDYNRISGLALAADVAFGLGDRDRARTLYQLLLPWAGRHAPGGAGVSYLGPFDQRLGMLQSLLGNRQQAVAHLRDAAAATERLGAPGFEAECRLHLARILAEDGPAQDAGAARRDVDRALELARPRALTPVVTEAEALRASL
jgi:tetratricopeptide (TPR) repeat protein